MSEDIWEERTFGTLQESHDKFSTDYRSQKKQAKFCNSTVETSLLEESPEVIVLDKCPLEELHYMTGFVNHTYFDSYVKVVGCEEKA